MSEKEYFPETFRSHNINELTKALVAIYFIYKSPGIQCESTEDCGRSNIRALRVRQVRSAGLNYMDVQQPAKEQCSVEQRVQLGHHFRCRVAVCSGKS